MACEAARSEAPRQPPVASREIVSLVLLVALADATIYCGAGYAGLAVLFGMAPGLLLLGSPAPKLTTGFWIVAGMLLLLAARMMWLGSALAAAIGFTLLVAFAVTLGGWPLGLRSVVICALHIVIAGYEGLAHYWRSFDRRLPSRSLPLWLSLALPLAALVSFGTLFVLANPDLVTSFVDAANRFWHELHTWLTRLIPPWSELWFWLIAAWIVVGLLRPKLPSWAISWPRSSGDASAERLHDNPEVFYAALRNTLVAVDVLFAVYLLFEFQTLWFRSFPKGFYYAGYAHEGAAWLTIALALATLVLSVVFRGAVLRDPRVGRLRRLAWIWSAENLLLALAVYNRMHIYISFNGMTRMRTIGLFGITTVVVGFLLVLWKLVSNRDFVWLVRRQIGALALAVYLFALTPVDALVHRYNVGRVLAGDLAPSVQISVHPINAEGVLRLHPLVRCSNPIIRNGIRAVLAKRSLEAEDLARRRDALGWTSRQVADDALLQRLRTVRVDWVDYLDDAKRTATLRAFDDYVYQWY